MGRSEGLNDPPLETKSRGNHNMDRFVLPSQDHRFRFIPHAHFQGRPATEDDILQLSRSFHSMAQQIVQEITTALRLLVSEGTSDVTRRNSREDESNGFGPRRRTPKPRAKYPGVKRRSAAENTLSVSSFNRGKLRLTGYSTSRNTLDNTWHP